LKMMLAQLLRNAWQFSATRPRAEISVSGRRDGDALELVIRDNGIGFDTAYAGKLLEPFQRLHGIEQGAGAGIGLATAQQVALRHGGGITGDAVVDAGAVFHVRLRDLVAGAA
ncbi:MAG: ATP-binding protein, partial [Lysobacteraceae bacterium]